MLCDPRAQHLSITSRLSASADQLNRAHLEGLGQPEHRTFLGHDYEVFKSPLEDFKRAVSEAGLDARVHYLDHGDTYEFEVTGTRGT